MLTVIDEYTKECLAIRPERRFRSDDVIHTLTELFVLNGVPEHLRSDNVLIAESRAFAGKTHPQGELQSVRSLVILCGLLGYPAMPALCMEVPLTIVTGVLFRPDVT